jgi:hypothetical protein
MLSKKDILLKNYSLVSFLLAVLIASIFFDDPHLYYYKRIVYVIFLYFSLYQLFIFNYGGYEKKLQVEMPKFYPVYIKIFFIFIAYNLLVDLLNPTFNLITLLNHPLALMAIVPVFAFKIGHQTTDTEKIYKLLLFISVAFLVFIVFPVKGNNIYNAAMTCYASVLPLFVFTLAKRKNSLYVIILLVLGFLLSQVSESRTIILRILLFSVLFTSFHFSKKYSFFKILIVLITGFFVYEMLTNLQDFINLFISKTGAKTFDDSDTRTFLYEELFGDLKFREVIFGRGFLGYYYSPYFFDQMQQGIAGGDSFNRFSIEIGFLQLLLKGGFVYYILYITPLVISCYKGLSANSPKLSYYISVILLTELFIMFIENIPVYGFPFFMMFFLAGFSCRLVSEAETKNRWRTA